METTHTNRCFPSGPISIFGGTRKLASRNMWKGIYKLMMSGLEDGRYDSHVTGKYAGKWSQNRPNLQFSRPNIFRSIVGDQVQVRALDCHRDRLKWPATRCQAHLLLGILDVAHLLNEAAHLERTLVTTCVSSVSHRNLVG